MSPELLPSDWVCDWKLPVWSRPGWEPRMLEISQHSQSTRPLSWLLNMSPIMIMPPRIHWPEPPNSGWENWAAEPLPLSTATSMWVTASGLKPVRGRDR